jgi:hypothetical protein
MVGVQNVVAVVPAFLYKTFRFGAVVRLHFDGHLQFLGDCYFVGFHCGDASLNFDFWAQKGRSPYR